MELNTRGRYAVMAMADLALHGSGIALPLNDIASRQQISLAYLEQIFARLRRAGLVESARGRSGGYRLARPASTIDIESIMQAVQEPVELNRCVAEGLPGCVGQQRCLTHELWHDLGNHIRGFLSSRTLQDVLDAAKARRCAAAVLGQAAE